MHIEYRKTIYYSPSLEIETTSVEAWLISRYSEPYAVVADEWPECFYRSLHDELADGCMWSDARNKQLVDELVADGLMEYTGRTTDNRTTQKYGLHYEVRPNPEWLSSLRTVRY